MFNPRQDLTPQRLTECLTGPWGRVPVEIAEQQQGVTSVLAQLNSHLMRERQRRRQEQSSPTPNLASS